MCIDITKAIYVCTIKFDNMFIYTALKMNFWPCILCLLYQNKGTLFRNGVLMISIINIGNFGQKWKRRNPWKCLAKVFLFFLWTDTVLGWTGVLIICRLAIHQINFNPFKLVKIMNGYRFVNGGGKLSDAYFPYG